MGMEILYVYIIYIEKGYYISVFTLYIYILYVYTYIYTSMFVSNTQLVWMFSGNSAHQFPWDPYRVQEVPPWPGRSSAWLWDLPGEIYHGSVVTLQGTNM